MSELFLAGIAFALELLAFSFGSCFIVWALRAQTTHPSGASSAKLAGSFIIILSTIALIGTSYYGAKAWLRGDPRPVRMNWKDSGYSHNKNMKRNHKMEGDASE